jgi:hypothetical protein
MSATPGPDVAPLVGDTDAYTTTSDSTGGDELVAPFNALNNRDRTGADSYGRRDQIGASGASRRRRYRTVRSRAVGRSYRIRLVVDAAASIWRRIGASNCVSAGGRLVVR